MQKNKKQKISLPKKEGIFGWMSYIGCPFIVFGCFSDTTSFHFTTLIGLILTIITMVKSKYPISLSTKTILFLFFAVATTMFELYIYEPEITFGGQTYYHLCGASITQHSWFYSWFCFFSFLWYLRYFYKKTKDGYRYVWLKAILFFLVLYILLFVFLNSTNDAGLGMEDVWMDWE